LSNQLNSYPILDFTSANSEYLEIINGILGTSTHDDVWVYYVSKSDAVQTNTIFNENLTAGEYFAGYTPWSDNNAYIRFGDGANGLLVGSWGSTVGTYNIWTMGISTGTSTPNGTRKTILRDGAAILSNNNNDNGTGNNSNFYIGGRYTGVDNYYFDGGLAELMVYTGVPTELEQEIILSYLAIKYGITKNSADNVGTGGQDERDYFASDGTVIRDYSANSGFTNNIVAIGRDDEGQYNQTTSQNTNPDAVLMINNPSGLDDKEFYIIGDNGSIAQANNTTDIPSGAPENVEGRLARVWRVSETNGDIGTVDLTFDNDIYWGTYTLSDIRLLIDKDGDGFFADETVAGGGVISGAVALN